MICPEYRDSIGLLVDGELSDDAALGVRAHLAVCSSCRDEYESLEALVSDLALKERDGLGIEESRFWRRFEHDLALRATRGETPFWSHSIALPFPLAILGLGTFVAITFFALSNYQEMREMQVRHRVLEASFKELQEESLFPKNDEGFVAGIEAISTPVERLVVPAPAGGGDMHRKASMRATGAPQEMNIRFIDSDGVIQPGDLY